jgi:hypothetical protein
LCVSVRQPTFQLGEPVAETKSAADAPGGRRIWLWGHQLTSDGQLSGRHADLSRLPACQAEGVKSGLTSRVRLPSKVVATAVATSGPWAHPNSIAGVCIEPYDSTRRRTVSGMALRACTTSGP